MGEAKKRGNWYQKFKLYICLSILQTVQITELSTKKPYYVALIQYTAYGNTKKFTTSPTAQ